MQKKIKVGIIGAGQLARMLVLSGTPLGIKFTCIGKPNDCANDIANVVDIDLNDFEMLSKWAKNLDVITFENENIDYKIVKKISAVAKVFPTFKAIRMAQDRLVEKETLQEIGIKTAEFYKIDNIKDIEKAVLKYGLPAIIKTRKNGYDGKGQYKLTKESDIKKAWEELKITEGGLIYEKFIKFDFEVSQLSVFSSNKDKQIKHYPLIKNNHKNGILIKSTAPFNDLILNNKAQEISLKIAKELDYVGLLATELFVCGNNITVNEIAPRVHNSGHLTIEASNTSQFESHVRAIVGIALGNTEINPSVMFNCIGGIPDLEITSKYETLKRHDYNKGKRFGRKIGHLTITTNPLKKVSKDNKTEENIIDEITKIVDLNNDF